eukprot:gb/GECH01003621.1/.p1 GENE.gb/GECH01003621.1/~~gb/GECH01003621.1/.p1  ORF type:complete len:338 (+),score=138.56 gb/GECH01003621.1/:1-1014(+)
MEHIQLEQQQEEIRRLLHREKELEDRNRALERQLGIAEKLNKDQQEYTARKLEEAQNDNQQTEQRYNTELGLQNFVSSSLQLSIDDMEMEKHFLQVSCERNKYHRKQAEDRIQLLRNQIDTLQEEFAEEQNEMAKKYKRLENRYKDALQAKEELKDNAKYKPQYHEANMKVSLLEKELEQAQEQISNLKDENSSSSKAEKSKITELKRALKSAKSTITQQEKEIQRLSSKTKTTSNYEDAESDSSPTLEEADENETPNNINKNQKGKKKSKKNTSSKSKQKGKKRKFNEVEESPAEVTKGNQNKKATRSLMKMRLTNQQFVAPKLDPSKFKKKSLRA